MVLNVSSVLAFVYLYNPFRHHCMIIIVKFKDFKFFTVLKKEGKLYDFLFLYPTENSSLKCTLNEDIRGKLDENQIENRIFVSLWHCFLMMVHGESIKNTNIKEQECYAILLYDEITAQLYKSIMHQISQQLTCTTKKSPYYNI